MSHMELNGEGRRPRLKAPRGQAEVQIVHNLHAARAAPDGTRAKLYSNNDWKSEDVVSDVREFFSLEDSQ